MKLPSIPAMLATCACALAEEPPAPAAPPANGVLVQGRAVERAPRWHPVGSLKSSGIAHPTKSDFYFAVSGKDALFDDLLIWSLPND